MTLSAEAEMEPGQMGSNWLVLCVLVLTCYSTSVPFRFSVHSVCVCMCVCWFDSWFVFGCCHCSPVLLVSSSSGPPFSSLCCQSLSLSFLSFRKGLWELRFNFYTFSPRALQIPGQLPLITPLQITFSLSLTPSLQPSLAPSVSWGLHGIIA